MKRLNIGEKATFKCFDGRIITGRVVTVHASSYVVIGDGPLCATYKDGLYRFGDKDIVRK